MFIFLIIILAIALLGMSALVFLLAKKMKEQTQEITKLTEKRREESVFWSGVFDDKAMECLDLEGYNESLEKDKLRLNRKLERAKVIIIEQQQTIGNMELSIESLHDVINDYEAMPGMADRVDALSDRIADLTERERILQESLTDLTEKIVDVKKIEDFVNGGSSPDA